MKLFISGSKSISVLSDEVKSIIDEHIAMGTEFLVGDCYGVDAAVQIYLESKGYRNVAIYCSGETPRNNFATGAKVHSCAEKAVGLTGSEFHYVKDIQMANDCDQAIMIWDGKSKGTSENIRRIKELNKPYKVINRYQVFFRCRFPKKNGFFSFGTFFAKYRAWKRITSNANPLQNASSNQVKKARTPAFWWIWLLRRHSTQTNLSVAKTLSIC